MADSQPKVSKLRNILIGVGVLVVIGVAIVLTSKGQPNPKGLSAEILVLIPETGPAAEFARYSKMGFDYAQSLCEEKKPGTIHLTYVDTKSNPKDGLSALQQSLAQQKPDVVVSMLSSVTKAVCPVLAENKIPTIANAVAAPGLARPSEGLYRVFPTSNDVSRKAAEAIHAEGSQNAVIVYINDEYGLGCKTTFTEQSSQAGVQLLASEPFEATEKDFRTQWERLLHLQPSAVFVCGYGPGYVAVLQQLAERTFEGLVVTDFTLTAPPVLKAIPAVGRKTLIIAPAIKSEFENGVKQRYADAGYFVNIGTAYDVVMLLAEAHDKALASSQELAAVLPQARVSNGAFGEAHFDANGDAVIAVAVYTIKDGTIVRNSLDLP